jgi:hypothetical protein
MYLLLKYMVRWYLHSNNQELSVAKQLTSPQADYGGNGGCMLNVPYCLDKHT